MQGAKVLFAFKIVEATGVDDELSDIIRNGNIARNGGRDLSSPPSSLPLPHGVPVPHPASHILTLSTLDYTRALAFIHYGHVMHDNR